MMLQYQEVERFMPPPIFREMSRMRKVSEQEHDAQKKLEEEEEARQKQKVTEEKDAREATENEA